MRRHPPARGAAWRFIIALPIAVIGVALALLLAGWLPGLEPVSSILMTRDEVQARAGAQLLWPGSLPSGATLTRIDLGQTGASGEGGMSRPLVELVWSGAATTEQEPLLRLSQGEAAAAPLGQPMRVRGQSTWLRSVPFTYQDRASAQRLGHEVRLWWNEGDVLITLSSRALPVQEITRIAETLAPLSAPARAPYREQHATGRRGTWMVAGPVDDFLTPSVTYLSDADLFLLRSEAGWFAFVNDPPHQGHPIIWDEATQLFRSPEHGETYDWRRSLHCQPLPSRARSSPG